LPAARAGTSGCTAGDKPYLVSDADGAAWVPHSYAQTKRDTDAIAQWLLDQGLGRDRPILILSGNSVAHALVKLGGMAAGVPTCPVSVNYGVMEVAFPRLRHVVELVRPGVGIRRGRALFAKALGSVDFGDAVIVTGTPDASSVPAVGLDEVLRRKSRRLSLRGSPHSSPMTTPLHASG
jgi:feruloyl-CoA synthase